MFYYSWTAWKESNTLVVAIVVISFKKGSLITESAGRWVAVLLKTLVFWRIAVFASSLDDSWYTVRKDSLCENSILLYLNSLPLDTVHLQELNGLLFNSKCWCWKFNILLWCKWSYSNHYWYHQLPSETDARKWIYRIKIVECLKAQ